MEEVETVQQQEEQIARTACSATLIAALNGLPEELSKLTDDPVLGEDRVNTTKLMIQRSITATLDCVQEAYHLVPKVQFVEAGPVPTPVPETAEPDRLSNMLTEFWDEAAG